MVRGPEEVSEIRIDDPLGPALYLFPHFAQGILRRSPSPISEAGIIEYRLEDRLQPIEQRLLTYAIIDRGYAEHAMLARFVPLFRSALAVSSFRLRARLDVSIPSAFSGQRGYEPRFLDMAPLI